MTAVEKFGQGNIKRLTDDHVKMYEGRVEQGKAGNPAIRLAECHRLLALWLSIREKEHDWDKLSPEEAEEVLEALDSGE